MRVRGVAALGVVVVVGGCTSAAKQVVPDPTNITIENAMLSVVRGLRLAEAASRNTGTQSLGLSPCTVEFGFDVTAGGRDRDSLVLDASIKGGNGVVSGGGEVKSESERTLDTNRGNHIKLLLTSASCIPANTLGATKPASVDSVSRQEQSIRVRRGTPWSGRVSGPGHIDLPGRHDVPPSAPASSGPGGTPR